MPDAMQPGLTSRMDARGFIVVAVLWILAALSALVLIYLTYVTNTAVLVAGSTDRLQTEALAGAGVELAALQLAGRPEAGRPTSGAFNARVGAGRVFVTFRSEAARIDLNTAPKSLLSGLMIGLGAGPSDAAVYADRILAWRAPTEQGDSDPENSFYRTSGAPYVPRHAPFPAAEELWLVRGIPSTIIERMLPFVTVFSNVASVNVLDAAPQVLAALPNMTPESLQSVLSQRSDPALDPRSLVGMAGGEGATLAGSRAYRIAVDVELPGGRRSAAEIVILLLESGDEPYRVLSWRNASDGSTALQKAALR
jgi:general secretion pathway protein K